MLPKPALFLKKMSQGLSHLRKLSLRNNSIRDITPLAELENLEYLAISWNKIEDLTVLKSHPSLRYLLVSNNPITDVAPIKHIAYLEYVWHGDGEGIVEHVAEVLSEESKAAHERKLLWRYGDGVCYAGWTFQPYKSCRHEKHGIESYNNTRSNACGVERVDRNAKTCRHESNGVEKWRETTEKRTFKLVGSERTVRERLRVRTGINWVDRWVYKVVIDPIPDWPHRADDLIKQCSRWKDKFKDANAHLSVEHKFLHKEPLRIEIECEVTIKVPERYNNAANPACGFDENTVYNACRHPSHGVELYKENTGPICGVSSELKQSSRGTEKTKVQQYFGNVVSCSSCDDIGAETSDERAKKIACLKTSLSASDYEVQKETKVLLNDLFLAKTDQLSESQVEFIQAAISN